MLNSNETAASTCIRACSCETTSPKQPGAVNPQISTR